MTAKKELSNKFFTSKSGGRGKPLSPQYSLFATVQPDFDLGVSAVRIIEHTGLPSRTVYDFLKRIGLRPVARGLGVRNSRKVYSVIQVNLIGSLFEEIRKEAGHVYLRLKKARRLQE